MDAFVHVGNVVECSYLFEAGKTPPFDWLPDIAGGRGGPNYRYYGSVSFWAPALLCRFGLEPEDAIRWWTVVVIVLGFVSAAIFSSLYGGWLGAMTGGVLFVYGPYYFSLPYSRASYPEHFAYSLCPLAFYFAARSARGKAWGSMLSCAVVLSFIIAAHTLSLLIVLPFLAVFIVGSHCSGNGLRAGAKSGSLTLLRLIAVVCCLLPASLVGPLLERNFVTLSEQFASAKSRDLYVNTAVPWFSLFHREFLSDITSRCVPGRVHLVVLIPAICLSLRMKNRLLRRICFFQLSMALSSLVLTVRAVAEVSVLVLPWLAYLQFPWRLLGMFNLFTATAVAGCVSKDSSLSKAGKYFFAITAALSCFGVYFRTIPDQDYRGHVTRTREGIRKSLTTLDHENKYMPTGAKTFGRPGPNVLLEITSGERFEKRADVNDYTYRVNSPFEQRAKFHQYWFEGWNAEVDGRAAPVLKDSSEGLCLIHLPAGVHEVHIYFARTMRHRVALAVSIAGWSGLIIAGGFLCTHRLRNRNGG